MRQLDSIDSNWVYLERPASPTQAMAVYVFDTGRILTHDEILTFVAERTAGRELFSQRLVRVPFDIDQPYWADNVAYDIGDHVISRPCASGWEALRCEIASIAATPLDMSKPPWELHFLTGLVGIPGGPDGATAVVTKIHHSAVDGVGSVDVARGLFTDAVPDVAARAAEPIPRRWSLFARGLGRLPRRVTRVWPALSEIRSAARQAKAEAEAGAFDIPKAVRPRTRFNLDITQGRTYDVLSLPLLDVRAVKMAIDGATVNDVMLAIVAGAMRTYLDKEGELPEASLGAMAPMSTRKFKAGAAANQFAMMLIDLHTDIDDLITRVEAIRDSSRSEQRRRKSAAVMDSEQGGPLIPGFAMRAISRIASVLPKSTTTVPYVNTVVSNVAYGAADMTLCGAPIVTIYGVLGLEDGQAVTHSVRSIGETLTISVIADPAALADTDVYLEMMRGAFADLQFATGQAWLEDSETAPRSIEGGAVGR